MWQKMKIINDPDLREIGGRALWVKIDRKPFSNEGPSVDSGKRFLIEKALETNIKGRTGMVVMSVDYLEHAPGDDSFAEEVPIVPFEQWEKRIREAA